jgi:hypothetical protein
MRPSAERKRALRVAFYGPTEVGPFRLWSRALPVMAWGYGPGSSDCDRAQRKLTVRRFNVPTHRGEAAMDGAPDRLWRMQENTQRQLQQQILPLRLRSGSRMTMCKREGMSLVPDGCGEDPTSDMKPSDMGHPARSLG